MVIHGASHLGLHFGSVWGKLVLLLLLLLLHRW